MFTLVSAISIYGVYTTRGAVHSVFFDARGGFITVLHIKLSIRKLGGRMERPWLIVREHGAYEQHAHMHTRKDAESVRRLIDCGRYPHCREYKMAMQRLLSEEEFKALDKKQRYFNPQRGPR